MSKSEATSANQRSGLLKTSITVVALAMIAFSVLILFRPVTGLFQTQAIHLGFALALVFLTSISKSKSKLWPIAVIFVVLSLVVTIYGAMNADSLQQRSGHPNVLDTVVGVITILMVLEACRRSMGPVLAIFTSICWAYALFGSSLPAPFGFVDISWQRTVNLNTIGFHEGIYGNGLEASFRFIFLFMVMGAILSVSGASGFFIEIAKVISSRFKSGVPISAVVSSALVGTVTGSALANVAINGVYTIPMMKKAGMDATTAAGLEAAASSGGQFMPPIMGTAAFLMAVLTGTPYIVICAMCAIPAVLYFLAIGFYAYFMAGKKNVAHMRVQVDVRELLLRAPLFLIPFAAIIIMLLMGYNAMFCAFWSIVILLVLSVLRKQTRPSINKIITGFTRGANDGAGIAVSCACVSSAVGLLIYTQLAMQITALVGMWSFGNMFLALLITAFVSIILGTGLPTLPAYLIVAILVVPVLMNLGVPQMSAHIFAFFFAVISYVTPPVALASLVAAKMAEAKYFPTAIKGFQIAIGGYVTPFMFVYCPILLLQPGQGIISIVMTFVGIILALWAIQAANCGYYFFKMSWWGKVLLYAVSVVYLVSTVQLYYVPFVIAVLVLAAYTVYQFRQRRYTTPVQALS